MPSLSHGPWHAVQVAIALNRSNDAWRRWLGSAYGASVSEGANTGSPCRQPGIGFDALGPTDIQDCPLRGDGPSGNPT
jgi:hypothetical protein